MAVFLGLTKLLQFLSNDSFEIVKLKLIGIS